jgi:phytoene desaturase
VKAAVIGSGLGGLAIAIRLAHKGYKVSVFEKNNHTGGKISEFRSGGFRFDTGPSLFTLPELTGELFDLAGEKMEDHFQFDKLDPICTYFYEDGTQLKAFSDPARFASEIEKQTGEPSKNVLKHLRKCGEMYDLTSEVFLFNSLHKFRNFLKWPVLRGLLQIYKVDVLKSMHGRNSRRFKDSRVIQLFDRFGTYNGSNPYIAPATLNVISHLEHNLGAFFPSGGMRSLVNELESLARRSGVSFHLGQKVDKISVTNKRATGLMVGNEHIPFDLIVSDVDINNFYTSLIPGSRSLRTNEGKLSSSALIFYWGIRGEIPSLGLHNVLFSNAYEDEFQYIFEKQAIHSNPTVYIYISSRAIPSDAPDHCENWFVMINVPPDTGQDWEKLIVEARQHIIRKINRLLKIRVEDLIQFEEVGSPGTIAKNTLSWKGALYGNHSNSRYSAFLRHPYRRRSVKNLFFVGGSVHPGGGIPLCLASARIVDQEIQPV